MRPTPVAPVFFFALLRTASLFAQPDSAQYVRTLPTSEVFASSPRAENADYQTFTAADWEGRALSLADLLAQEAGVQTRRTGGMGSFQSLSIRGMGANQVVVCIDGVPITGGHGGAVDLGVIDLSQYERVELYKGYVPARFGGNGMGGAINLISRTAAKKSARLTASYGSHGSHEIALQAAGPWGDSLYGSSVVAQRGSANDYEFLDRNGTLYNTADDQWEKRQNAQYAQWSGNHNLRVIHAHGSSSTWQMQHSQESAGIPGRESSQTVTAGSGQSSARLHYLWESAPDGQAFDHSAEAFAQFWKTTMHWYYPLDKIGVATDAHMQSGVLAQGGGGRWNVDFRSGDHGFFLETSVEGAGENLQSRDYSEELATASWTVGHAQGQLSTKAGRELGPWLRWEAEGLYRASRDHFSGGEMFSAMINDYPRSDVYRHLWSGRGVLRGGSTRSPWQTFVTGGRYFRAPEPLEMYGTSRGMLPNPDLKPETGLQGEAGLSYQGHDASAKVSFFVNRAEGRIVWITSGSLSKPLNLGQSKVQGIEAQLQGTPLPRLKLEANATWQRPLDASGNKDYDGNLLPDEPEQAYVGMASIKLPYTLQLQWTAEARSHLFRDRANRERIPAQQFHHLGVSCAPRPGSELRFNIRNLGDAEYQDIYAAWPTPGRQYNIAFSQNF